jgi:tyrosyl-tRNA synthetase
MDKYGLVSQSPGKIEDVLTRGVAEVLPTKEGLAELMSKKKITLYQGFDPTGAQLHIGHAVGLKKLAQFQALGHKVIFLIGDFTGIIGDPSGKSTERKVLTKEEVLENAKTYKEQAGRILKFDGDNPAEIKYNSEWLGKMSAIEFLQLSHNLTYAQVIERDMFQERIKKGNDIYMNEFLYPFMQAYDSVAMNVDLEIGGQDQKFNMLMGRKLMRNILHKEKYVMTLPLLTDSKGTKIGKTEGNVIGLTDPANEFYAKIMSLSDDSIVNCFTILTDKPLGEMAKIHLSLKNN